MLLHGARDFPGELEATRELTAHENGIPAEQIATRKETR